MVTKSQSTDLFYNREMLFSNYILLININQFGLNKENILYRSISLLRDLYVRMLRLYLIYVLCCSFVNYLFH